MCSSGIGEGFGETFANFPRTHRVIGSEDKQRRLFDLGWTEDHYVKSMTRLLCRSLLST